jgi:hypothetical protein
MANDPSDRGVAAAVFSASWLMRTLGLEIMTFGRPADAKFFDCELTLTGKHLLYSVRLDHDWLFFRSRCWIEPTRPNNC